MEVFLFISIQHNANNNKNRILEKIFFYRKQINLLLSAYIRVFVVILQLKIDKHDRRIKQTG